MIGPEPSVSRIASTPMPRSCGSAMLAIWSDIAPEHETDYMHWLTREHCAERVSTPGFDGVRMFRAMLDEVCRYFICYDLQSPDVIDSPEYLAKLDRPTAWSQRIMPLLKNFKRGGGSIRAKAGSGEGGVLAPVILQSGLRENGEAIAQELAQQDRIVAVSILEVDQTRTAVPTREKSMRKHDDSFAGLLLIEGLTAAAVGAARDRLASLQSALIPADARMAPLYRLVFALHKHHTGRAT